MALLGTAAGQILGAEESPELMEVLEGKNHESSLQDLAISSQDGLSVVSQRFASV
jgi:hypothetical protein